MEERERKRGGGEFENFNLKSLAVFYGGVFPTYVLMYVTH